MIVNISSIARYGNRGQSNYSAAKAALATNTKTWAQEFAPFGIRVGAVAPGMIETPMTQGMNQKARDALVAAIPVGRIGLPEDIWVAVKLRHRVRLLQRPDHRRRRRPLHVIAAGPHASGPPRPGRPSRPARRLSGSAHEAGGRFLLDRRKLKAIFNIKVVMYVCLCHGVTDREILETIADGASSLEEVAYCTRAGTRCGSCVPAIAAHVQESAPGAEPERRCLRVLTSAA